MDEAFLRGLCRFPGGRDWCLPLVGGAESCTSGGQGCVKVFREDCRLRKTLSSPFAGGWGRVPAPLVVWPEISHHCRLRTVGWS